MFRNKKTESRPDADRVTESRRLGRVFEAQQNHAGRSIERSSTRQPPTDPNPLGASLPFLSLCSLPRSPSLPGRPYRSGYPRVSPCSPRSLWFNSRLPASHARFGLSLSRSRVPLGVPSGSLDHVMASFDRWKASLALAMASFTRPKTSFIDPKISLTHPKTSSTRPKTSLDHPRTACGRPKSPQLVQRHPWLVQRHA